MNRYDAIVIGTGQAGPSLVEQLAHAGMRGARIEQGKVGGTCVTTAVTPTKTQLASAYVAQLARRAAEYGVTIPGAIRVDMRRVKARKDALVERSRRSLEQRLRSLAHTTVYTGNAR